MTVPKVMFCSTCTSDTLLHAVPELQWDGPVVLFHVSRRSCFSDMFLQDSRQNTGFVPECHIYAFFYVHVSNQMTAGTI